MCCKKYKTVAMKELLTVDQNAGPQKVACNAMRQQPSADIKETCRDCR